MAPWDHLTIIASHPHCKPHQQTEAEVDVKGDVKPGLMLNHL